ncbi:MAG: metal ABC transporter permease [Anaerolineae bacterium]|jgi:manganese/iron transport system permease protein|nr:metal ABC transporter permease [Anaerolineae bacterium]
MAPLLEILVAPLRYPFMVRGIVAAILVGIVCALVGTYMVLRGMAFLGDALAHSILPGIAVGYIVSGGGRGPIFWWGLGTGILTALGIGALGKGAQVKEDTAIGIIFSGMFALGIALISTMRSYAVDLSHFLFGDVLGVSPSDLWLTAGLAVLVSVIVFVFYKEFLVLAFDSTLAETLRFPSGFLHYLLMVLIALTIVVALQTVGIALMVAMLTTPAATAYLLTKRMAPMMGIAALIGAVSGIVGLYLSYYVSVASGAAIVLVCTGIFLLALLFSPRRGIVRGWLQSRG